MRRCYMEELKCKKCNKVLAEADFTGTIRKYCKNCKTMNIYFKRLGGKTYHFIEAKEE